MPGGQNAHARAPTYERPNIHGRGPQHLWYGFNPFQVGITYRALASAIPVIGHIHREDEPVLGYKSSLDIQKFTEAPHQQTGTDQQNQGESNLGCDQSIPQSPRRP
jgi:hypothetical protein